MVHPVNNSHPATPNVKRITIDHRKQEVHVRFTQIDHAVDFYTLLDKTIKENNKETNNPDQRLPYQVELHKKGATCCAVRFNKKMMRGQPQRRTAQDIKLFVQGLLNIDPGLFTLRLKKKGRPVIY